MDKTRPTVIDLFAGAGGMSEGFNQSGFKILAANEILIDAVKTYKLNHKDTKVFTGDIQKISVNDFKKECGLNGEKIDMVVGGPPCQGFSMANRQRLIDDPRNSLYRYFIKFVKKINPRFFVMENVKGMKNKAPEIVEDFRKIGYTAKYEILNARKFGIPQNRERLFFIGTNVNNNSEDDSAIIDKIFTGIINDKWDKEISLKEALWGLRKIKPLPRKHMTQYESKEYGLTDDIIIKTNKPIPDYIMRINKGKAPTKVYNHKTRYNNERDKEIFRRLPPGGKSDHHSIQDIMPYKNRSHVFKDKFYKLLPDVPSKTITAHMKFDCHMYIHPFESRGLTPREAARVQSFPDDYKFLGSFTRWYLQIGNAVPPLLAKVIAKNILTELNTISS